MESTFVQVVSLFYKTSFFMDKTKFHFRKKKPHLPRALHSLHEAEEHDHPGDGERHRQLPVEPPDVEDLLREGGGDLEDVLLPELGSRRLLAAEI